MNGFFHSFAGMKEGVGTIGTFGTIGTVNFRKAEAPFPWGGATGLGA